MPKGTTIITAKTSNILHKCVIYICLSDIRIYIFGEGKGIWGKEGSMMTLGVFRISVLFFDCSIDCMF